MLFKYISLAIGLLLPYLISSSSVMAAPYQFLQCAFTVSYMHSEQNTFILIKLPTLPFHQNQSFTCLLSHDFLLIFKLFGFRFKGPLDRFRAPNNPPKQDVQDEPDLDKRDANRPNPYILAAFVGAAIPEAISCVDGVNHVRHLWGKLTSGRAESEESGETNVEIEKNNAE